MRRRIVIFSLLGAISLFASVVILRSSLSADEAPFNEGDKAEIQDYVEKGNTYFNQKLYNEAINSYKKALESKQYPQIYSLIGDVYFAMRDYKNAEINYLEVIHLAEMQYKDTMSVNPNVEGAYHNLSYFYSKDNKYDKVIAICNKGLGLYPNDTFLLNNLANAYMENGLYKEAIATIEKALVTNPTLAVAHYTYGEIFEKTGEYVKALNEFEKVRKDLKFGNSAQEKILKINNLLKGHP